MVEWYWEALLALVTTLLGVWGGGYLALRQSRKDAHRNFLVEKVAGPVLAVAERLSEDLETRNGQMFDETGRRVYADGVFRLELPPAAYVHFDNAASHWPVLKKWGRLSHNVLQLNSKADELWSKARHSIYPISDRKGSWMLHGPGGKWTDSWEEVTAHYWNQIVFLVRMKEPLKDHIRVAGGTLDLFAVPTLASSSSKLLKELQLEYAENLDVSKFEKHVRDWLKELKAFQVNLRKFILELSQTASADLKGHCPACKKAVTK